MSEEITNHDRAQSAAGALQAFMRWKYTSPQAGDAEEDIADLIGNLLHLAKEDGCDPVTVAKRAIGMWSTEDGGNENESNHSVMIYINGAER